MHAVIGAGNSGLAMAAYLAYHGERVALWNRTFAHIARVADSRTIECRGTIQGEVPIALATSDIGAAIADAEFILVTTPASAHKDVAREMAPYVRRRQKVILNPGRTLGAVEFAKVLRESGCREQPQIAETQTIVHTCRKAGETAVEIFRNKNEVMLACLDSELSAGLISQLPECLRASFIPAKSIVHTSVGNVGMVLHCFPVLMNVGWIENESVGFKYYYDGITPSVARALEVLDRERIEVARQLGHVIEDIVSWFRRSYGLHSGKLYEAIQENEAYRTIDAPASLRHRYLYEDIPCGLVPLESMGLALGMKLPMTSMCIDLASTVLGEDFRRGGRTLGALGLSIEELQSL